MMATAELSLIPPKITGFVEACYRTGREGENTAAIPTGANDDGAQIDFSSFGNVDDPDVWQGEVVLSRQARSSGGLIAELLADLGPDGV
ncbi:MAG: hypothetical protein AAGF94_04435 [Pseudomonadota bacterium]